jgi:hypothetical protein
MKILIKQLKRETVGTLTALANSQNVLSSQLKTSQQQAQKYSKLTIFIKGCMQQLNNSELAVLPFLRLIAHRIEISV